MRLLAPLAAAAALLTSLALPAEAVKRDVRVPFLHCTASVETWEAAVSFNRRDVRDLAVDYWGVTSAGVVCPAFS